MDFIYSTFQYPEIKKMHIGKLPVYLNIFCLFLICSRDKGGTGNLVYTTQTNKYFGYILHKQKIDFFCFSVELHSGMYSFPQDIHKQNQNS